ncbi:MAG: MBL fold metallo-hydrolase [Elusimicrobiota bacterium]|jgi:glyoxylase-like metal-dependent hydrolase (beta-lactamase superfamily II)
MIRRLRLGSMANIAYLISDPESKDCAVVDPGWEVPKVLGEISSEGWTLRSVILTHHHFDHSDGVQELLRSAQVPVFIHEDDAAELPALAQHLHPIKDGHVLSIGSLSVECLHTPGHTQGSQCLRVTQSRPGADGGMQADRLLTGDTLFVGACGRVDLPDSDPLKMYYSLRRLCGLPDEWVILPGHAYAARLEARLGDQKRDNPYLKACMDSTEGFLNQVGA